ncbi:MAG TPA: histidinol dehydrogenase [Acidimicrobiales bacterium]|nr:histidinol dehydrogenase [Acidimicrobiales bacterium]
MMQILDLRNSVPGDPLNLPRPDLGAEGPVAEVRKILSEVKNRGDAAIREFSERFDGVRIDHLRVDADEIAQACDKLPGKLLDALTEARDSIEAFYHHQPEEIKPYRRGGIEVRHLLLPVDRAGVYAPGGRAKYPSSVLMTAVPARVAGVGAIACCVPPASDGSLPVEVLAAASLAGVDEVYRVGGAQAIAAMAFGTESIPKVDVIVGPGSKWVSIAQREVRGVVGVPAAFAGPSEVVVIADERTPVDWAAIDVIVQAEHGPDGLAWLVTWSESAARAISEMIDRLVEISPRREETQSTLKSGGYVVLVDSPERAMEVANAIAPEHLEILTDNAEDLLPLVRHAGAIFLGHLAPASVGDYIAGPSHVLPTFATARFASVLGIEDFTRRVHAVRVDQRGIERVARHVATIAGAEGLPAHAESVLMRIGEPTWSKEL